MKPFVKRQKNDAADAEAICEAASRPTMRFVAVKPEEQQARGMRFRTRELLVRQRTQTINALRGHLAEFGVVAPRGPAYVGRLAEAIEDADSGLEILRSVEQACHLELLYRPSHRTPTQTLAARGETPRRTETGQAPG